MGQLCSALSEIKPSNYLIQTRFLKSAVKARPLERRFSNDKGQRVAILTPSKTWNILIGHGPLNTQSIQIWNMLLNGTIKPILQAH